MCRIAAYMGARCALGDFLTAPPHSLARQSWDAREMVSATVNADGWGAAWFDDDAKPARYRHILPIWADVNLDSLARSLHASVWLANVRSATSGLGTDQVNTQPFCDDRLLFTHNGFIDRFAHTLRARMRDALAPEIERDIAGNTDSEYLFALLRQQRGTLAERLRTSLARVSAWLGDMPDVAALLNVVVTDGNVLVACRAAANADAPSLYCNPDWNGAAVIASEAFDDDAGWFALEPQQMVVCTPGQPPRLEPL